MNMDRRGLLILAGIAGFVGGVVSNLFLGTALVSAQTKVEKVVMATRFQLVDGDGHLRGFFSADPDGTSILSLCDKNGTPRAAARRETGWLAFSERLWRERGRGKWLSESQESLRA
jgi:hypothetical protein